MISQSEVRWIGASTAAAMLSLDQLTKQWALALLGEPGGHHALPGPIDLTLVFNQSNAFGMVPVAGDFSRWALVVLNLGVAAVLTWVLWRRRSSRVTAAGMGFVIAGAVGNAVDRIRYGAVVDFVDASAAGFPWVFNVADAALDVGIVLLLLGAVSGNREGGLRSPAR
jgi:signal peptidase II